MKRLIRLPKKFHSLGLIALSVAILLVVQTVGSTTYTANASAPASASVDLTHLPLGDGKLSTSPKVGWIWPCHIDNSVGGSFQEGPWFNGDGTYNFTAKAVVPGSVSWPHEFSITVQGDKRVFVGNDLPDHPTGIYPIPSNSDAFNYDRNPNSIKAQTVSFELPTNPTLLAQPSCAPGAVGVLLTGSSLFSALDAPGRDAVAHELQDACGGHPQVSGNYHYHNLSNCVNDAQDSTGHSVLVGYALDGFGIFGHYGEGGQLLTSADLDECHGHTHEIDWDGQKVIMYHYHATYDFPYTVGCMKGKVDMSVMMMVSGGREGGQPGGQNGQSGQGQGGQLPPPPAGQQGGNRPPRPRP